MDLLKLDAESLSEMKAFYQEELAKAIRRIDHINKVLTQLGEPGAQLELRIGDDRYRIPSTKTSISKRKYKKKRGPKSKWDKVILKTLKQAAKPLSYDELTDYLMISEAREPSKRVNTKATVQNTVFRLRHEKKLRTFSLGSRTKYIAPVEWFEGEEIKREYQNRISLPEKKEKKNVAKRGPGRPPKKRGPGRPPKNTTAAKTKRSDTRSLKKKPTPEPNTRRTGKNPQRLEKSTKTRTKSSTTKVKAEQTKAKSVQPKATATGKKTKDAEPKKATTRRRPLKKSSTTPKTERKFLIKKTVKK